MTNKFDRDYFETANKTNGLSDYWNKQTVDCVQVADRIEMLIKGDKTRTILEVGCAYGQTISELKRRGYMGYGVDISDYAITEGKARLNNPDLMSADIQDKDFVYKVINGFGKPTFDFVFSCITLEHIYPYNTQRVISNLRKLTTPGGVNYHAIDLERGNDKTHYCILTRQKWIELFASAGFEYVPIPEEWARLNWFVFKKI